MNKQKNILLTAAFGLIMSAISPQTGHTQSLTTQAVKSTSIKISALPFNITAPGTYVLTGNLTCSLLRSGSGPSLGAINISTAAAGPVVVDLNGFTITGPGSNSFAVTIGVLTTEGNTYPITIKNGTISNFEYALTGIGTAPKQNNLSDIIANNIVFDVTSTPTAVGYGINFVYVNSSSISNCTINGATVGIADSASVTGNSYNGITFLNTPFPLNVEQQSAPNSPFVLDHCLFSVPPAK